MSTHSTSKNSVSFGAEPELELDEERWVGGGRLDLNFPMALLKWSSFFISLFLKT